MSTNILALNVPWNGSRVPADVTTAAGTGDSAGASEQKARILVVDDVPDNRDILMRRLARRGFDVVEAIGGHDALDKLASQHFDMVLLDIMMPDLGGNDVLRHIRSTHSDVQMPVIMVTAKTQSEDVVESLTLGANDYVIKPVDFSVALARINTQLARKRAADAERRARKSLELEAARLQQMLEQQNDQRRHSEDRLRYLAYHDSLTGLLNRAAFRDLLTQALDRQSAAKQEPALLFVDLDRFKVVNDSHGHDVGDKLLKAVAVRLCEVVSEGIEFARLGGDEFGAIISDGVQPDAALREAKRIVEALRQPFIVDGQQVFIGASCGVARASSCADDLELLIKAADIAMYHAKASGRSDAVLFEPRMLEEQAERRALEGDLRRAVQRGELEVVYQPLVDMATGSVTTFEAQLRWPHPTRGMIPPESFLPLAEETGLIFSLGEWAMRKACAEAATWPADIGVALSLTPLQFRSPNLLSRIFSALAASGLSPARLELEICETALLRAEDHSHEILRSLRNLGVRVSIGDFCDGHASLSYLRNFEADRFKIERRFVHGLEAGPSAEILKAINALGIRTGAGVIQPGIYE